ncbi:MAG TPA: hypothetical protein VMV89_03155 [Candidatus Paceibacterota bacterium]|nr:hypothetical protein [Candidatus Paceibacterota bacterium]
MKATNRTSKKTPAKRFKGISSDAIALNVGRVHLWQVLTGRRESKPLLARLADLKKQQAKTGIQIPAKKPLVPIPIELAAAENLAPFFFNTLAKLKLEVIIVRFDASKDSPIWKQVGIELELERELQSVQAGFFDSSYFPMGAQWHFFHVGRPALGKAMQAIKSALDARGLLPFTTLLHAESPGELREWYPGNTAAMISADADTEA